MPTLCCWSERSRPHQVGSPCFEPGVWGHGGPHGTFCASIPLTGRRERLSSRGSGPPAPGSSSVGLSSRQLRRNGPAALPSQANGCFPESPVHRMWSLGAVSPRPGLQEICVLDLGQHGLQNVWSLLPQASQVPKAPGREGLSAHVPVQHSEVREAPHPVLRAGSLVHSWASLGLRFHKRQPGLLG